MLYFFRVLIILLKGISPRFASCFRGFVSLVSVVSFRSFRSFRWFRFVFSGFSTCRLKDAINVSYELTNKEASTVLCSAL